MYEDVAKKYHLALRPMSKLIEKRIHLQLQGYPNTSAGSSQVLKTFFQLNSCLPHNQISWGYGYDYRNAYKNGSMKCDMVLGMVIAMVMTYGYRNTCRNDSGWSSKGFRYARSPEKVA